MVWLSWTGTVSLPSGCGYVLRSSFRNAVNRWYAVIAVRIMRRTFNTFHCHAIDISEPGLVNRSREDDAETVPPAFEEATMIKSRVVVGVDGSAGSTAAVRWAAVEAQRREADLRVLAAYHRQHPGGHLAEGGQARPVPDAATAAVMHEAVALARSVAPGVDVRCVALPGYAVPVLLHAAEDAVLLVVGTRGGGALPGLPYGPVSSQLATHARTSVVVVRGRSGADTGPVVVGVDDGPSAGTVIGRAFEEASLHGAPLLAVTAQAGRRRPYASTGEAVLGADLDSELDPWREKYREVPVEREIVPGDPDKVLVQRSRQARLVVAGPRRHGFEGKLLGPVGTRLLQRAECPVLIAR
jgi:nucleotide-binding universal stress UspA family protein